MFDFCVDITKCVCYDKRVDDMRLEILVNCKKSTNNTNSDLYIVLALF